VVRADTSPTFPLHRLPFAAADRPAHRPVTEASVEDEWL